MRRPHVTRLAVAAFALAMLGAPCTTTGPGPRDFEAGALVIPMDNCYQRRNGATANQTVACNTADDDGVFRAYGLVYFLLQKGVTVYWAIDGATPKAGASGVTMPDLVIPAPATGAAVRKYSWASRSVVDFTPAFPAATGLTYIGGPFVIDPADKARALDLLANDADIAKVRNRDTVDIHEVQVGFHANQVRPLSGTPPRLAILGINPKPYHKTSFDVMYRYAAAAGFDWPCTPASGDCAGGLGAGCDAAVVQRYLADTLCATGSNPNCADRVNECYEGCSPNWVSPDITGAQLNPPGVPGKVYDVLCDGDFTGAYADSNLARGGYKLLWAPHWDTAGFDPASATGAGATLGQQLRNIAAFVQAGNNLFAECAAIGALETGRINGSSGALLRGVAETQFQTTAGMVSTVNNTTGTVLSPFLAPEHPNLQVGDFGFSLDSGAIARYYPDRATPATSAYRPGVERLVSSTVSGSTVPWDISGTRQVTTSDGVKVGTVAYLGGHDYSPSTDGTDRGQTAGTRIVLNTLFNLGFACADPNTTCQVEGVNSNSACALGVLKCSGAGGFTCVPNVRPGDQAEACGNGIDDDCDGTVDEGCAGTCTPAATRPCDGGAPAAQICVAGTQTCSAAGIWGACEGLRLKSPEACNGVDDDCDGTTDEGTICPFGQTCSGGVCLPQPCDLEVRCPAGYTCTGTSPASVCTPNPCAGGAPCPAGRVCSAGACVDPCASVHCGPGSTCSGGVCFGGACYTSGCPSGQLCQAGQCQADPCAGLSCPQGTFCRAGACVRSCAGVTCADGQHCGIDGFCEPGPACAVSCGSGQVCQGGQCVPDPACGGVGCGQGQVCRGGSCIDDPCSGVTCPSGTCQGGQCTGGAASAATVPKEPGTKSGCGCGSAGGLDLLALAAGLALFPRLRRRAAPRGGRPGSSRAGAAAVLALALGTSACGGKTAAERCPSASTPCGTLCCASGYACQAGSCVFGTQNPVVLSVSPSRAGVGSSVTLTLTGEGFQAGAEARLTGAGLPARAPLDVTSATAATLILDLSQAAPGTAEIRVVNPADHLASNAATLALTSDPVPVGVSPTSIRQDAAAPFEVRVSGSAFGSGLVVTLTGAGGGSRDFGPVAVSAQEATIQVDPATLAVGVYDVTVRFPGGNVSPVVKLAVVEGLPIATAMTPTCALAGTSFVGGVSGSFLYPSSTVHVSGGLVPDSPLITRCAQAAPAASGQCQGGQLEAVVDLTGVANGDYQVWVVNPGAPALASTPKLTFRVASTCP